MDFRRIFVSGLYVSADFGTYGMFIMTPYTRVGHSTKVFLKPVISMAILVTDDESIGIFDQL